MENELNSWALDFEDTVYRLLKVYMESKEIGIKVTQDEESNGTPVFQHFLYNRLDLQKPGEIQSLILLTQFAQHFKLQ